MVPELLDDDMADDELRDATLGGAADKRGTKLLDAKMADGELLDTDLGGIGAETADQPDTETFNYNISTKHNFSKKYLRISRYI